MCTFCTVECLNAVPISQVSSTALRVGMPGELNCDVSMMQPHGTRVRIRGTHRLRTTITTQY